MSSLHAKPHASLGKLGFSEKTADQLRISLLSAWGVHYFYPPRNVFKELLRLTGALPIIIILSDGCHTLKESQKSFMKCFPPFADETVVKISSRDTVHTPFFLDVRHPFIREDDSTEVGLVLRRREMFSQRDSLNKWNVWAKTHSGRAVKLALHPCLHLKDLQGGSDVNWDMCNVMGCWCVTGDLISPESTAVTLHTSCNVRWGDIYRNTAVIFIPIVCWLWSNKTS